MDRYQIGALSDDEIQLVSVCQQQVFTLRPIQSADEPGCIGKFGRAWPAGGNVILRKCCGKRRFKNQRIQHDKRFDCLKRRTRLNNWSIHAWMCCQSRLYIGLSKKVVKIDRCKWEPAYVERAPVVGRHPAVNDPNADAPPTAVVACRHQRCDKTLVKW